MSWRALLFLGTLVAIVLASIGFTLDTSDLRVHGTADPQADSTWPSPFGREVWYMRAGRHFVLDEGDERLWYFAAGAVFVLTLAAAPLLRERDKRRGSSEGSTA